MNKSSVSDVLKISIVTMILCHGRLVIYFSCTGGEGLRIYSLDKLFEQLYSPMVMELPPGITTALLTELSWEYYMDIACLVRHLF